MVVLSYFLLGMYLLFLLLVDAAWAWSEKKNDKLLNLNANYLPRVSVIIPFRNEEENLPKLWQSLKKQNYPENCIEIIFIDDHSEDGGLTFLEKATAQTTFQVKILNLEGDDFGKKSAISKGIAHASHELIFCTDADCYFAENWISLRVKPFEDPMIQMSPGMVYIAGDSLWAKLQSIEFASLLATGAASAALGLSGMANGANLAYRKEAFLSIGGYQTNAHIASGDDEFLLDAAYKQYGSRSIFFQNIPGSEVYTRPASTFSQFFSQRIRWASKWNKKKWHPHLLLAPFVFFVHLLWLTLPVLGIFGYGPQEILILWLQFSLLRLVFEAHLLQAVLKRATIDFSYGAFFIVYLIYPLYVTIFALSSVMLSTTWKNRKI